MPLRTPPGRAGRRWLQQRIEAGGRGADVLDQKRKALLREQARLREELETVRDDWERLARQAAEWARRAAVLAGTRPLRVAAAHIPPARIELAWRSALGVVYPADVEVSLADRPDLGGLGSAALLESAAAHRRALEAAARAAQTQAAYERLTAELGRTVRRLRAIEKRWLPEHRQALASLELALDEAEREEAARLRWIQRRLDAESSRD